MGEECPICYEEKELEALACFPTHKLCKECTAPLTRCPFCRKMIEANFWVNPAKFCLESLGFEVANLGALFVFCVLAAVCLSAFIQVLLNVHMVITKGWDASDWPAISIEQNPTADWIPVVEQEPHFKCYYDSDCPVLFNPCSLMTCNRETSRCEETPTRGAKCISNEGCATLLDTGFYCNLNICACISAQKSTIN